MSAHFLKFTPPFIFNMPPFFLHTLLFVCALISSSQPPLPGSFLSPNLSSHAWEHAEQIWNRPVNFSFSNFFFFTFHPHLVVLNSFLIHLCPRCAVCSHVIWSGCAAVTWDNTAARAVLFNERTERHFAAYPFPQMFNGWWEYLAPLFAGSNQSDWPVK